MSQLIPAVPSRRALFLPATLVENGRDNPGQPQLESEHSVAKLLNLSPEEMRKQKEIMAEADRKFMQRATEESIDITKQQEALEQFAAENEAAQRQRQAHMYDEIPGVNQGPDRHRHRLQTSAGRNQGYDENRYLSDSSHAEQSQSQMYGDPSYRERYHADAQQNVVDQPRKHDATAPQYDRNQPDRLHQHDATASQYGRNQHDQPHKQYRLRDQDFHAATDIGASSLSVGSSIGIPAPEPNKGMRYGTIKWIGTPQAVKGMIAGIELVMHIS
jgi:hypothetical protein